MSTSASGIRAPRQTGISLVELVLFIAIVSIGIAGILSVMNVTTKSSADPFPRKQAMAIAESMLEEIQLKDFSNPADPNAFIGAAIQANRALFDDIGDYHGFTSAGIFPVDGGTPIAGLEAYNVNVTVVTDGGLGTGASLVPAADARLITVTVTGPGATVITLSGYRTNYAP